MQNRFNITDQVYQSLKTEVYRAVCIDDGTPVVLKIKTESGFSKSKSRLYYEYALGKCLHCERVVRHLALDHFSQKSILVLQDDGMMPLESVIPPQGFDIAVFFRLAVEIISAIEEIHSEKIIHKDINPSNIIVNSELDAVKLIDFGLATGISEEMVGFEPPADLEGTLSFISPEQTGRINRPVDSRSDLYSAGVTFYQMLTGKLPFEGVEPIEMIYSHIARIPASISEIRQDIPKALALVIETLLKKSPDERYQTAKGVKEDLLFIQEAMMSGNRIIDFVPGANEHNGRLVLSGKLYGRTRETEKLYDCFQKSRESGQIITVTGTAGIGKTALISELYTPITQQKGFFLSGKFDQLNKGLAYTALADALKDFADQCCGQDDITTKRLRNAVQASVSEFGRVLTEIVPEFQNLIGKQPSIATVSPQETMNRRNLVFSNLITDICLLGYPIVIFIDDLQWADSASLSLLENIVEKNSKNLFIILSYRDDEISQAHPAALFLETIRKKKSGYATLHLENLTAGAMAQWINDILPSRPKGSGALADIVLAKTEGNPFYITSLLNLMIEKKFIHYKEDGGIFLNLEAIATLPADADVVEYLIRKIGNLDNKDREFLTRISILGNRFPIETVELVSDTENGNYQDSLQALAAAHLLIKSGDTLMFAHDRVQQAARSLLDESRARVLHLEAGQNIKAMLEEQHLAGENIEKYIHHFNAAEKLITDSNQRLEMAKLNVLMGKQLKSNAAYQAAEASFAQAIAFMPEKNPFETEYRMAIGLFTEYGESLFLNLKYEEGEKQFDKVLKHSKSPIDSAEVYIKQINHYAANHNLEKSMGIALHALDTLGVVLPKKFLKLATIVNLLKVKRLLKDKKPEDIPNQKVTEDPLVLAQMGVLSAAAAPTYIAYPDFFPVIIFKMVEISVKKGHCNISPFAYVPYGLILCSIGETELGYAYGKAGITLMETLDAKAIFVKTIYIFAVFIHHWKAPAKESLQLIEQAISKGLETGAYEFASYAVDSIMHTLFYSGSSIDSLLRLYPGQHKLLQDFGKEHSMAQAKFFNQLLITMNDPDCDGITVSGELLDENSFTMLMEERQDLPMAGIYMIEKMKLAYMAGQYKTAMGFFKQSTPLTKGLIGTVFIPVYHFFAVLTCVAYCRTEKKDGSLLKTAKRSLKKLKKWGADAPENYRCKALLAEAEIFSLSHDRDKALHMYEAAAENASRTGNSMDIGLACECMGRYLLNIGLESLGLIQIQRSITVFQNWGALNKSNRLKKEFTMGIIQDGTRTVSTGSNATISSEGIRTRLDLDALSGTIKSLTRDLNFNSLLETLLTAVMQNSGATRVVYLQVENGQLYVRAEKPASGAVKIFAPEETRPASLDLPVTLLEKCYSGSDGHILENIKMKRAPLHADPVVPRLKSILILPLKRDTSVSGMVYLENDLLENAFREEHVQFLSLLAGQAAIAIENARMFENLNTEKDYSASIIRNAPTLICGIDKNGVTTFINPVIPDITGYSRDELIGRNWWELFYPDEQYEQVKKLFTLISKGDVEDYEMSLRCKNGEKRNIVWNYVARRGADNRIVEITGFGNDITRRNQMENELRNLRNYLSNIINSMPSALIGIDTHFRVTQWNLIAEKNTGIPASEAQGKLLSDVCPEMALHMEPIGESIRSREVQQELKQYRLAETTPFFEDITIYPLVTNGVEGAVIRIDDVTEKVRMEEMMIQSEKMLSLGGLAAGMAHEINNPLAGMMQTVDVMKNRLVNTTMPANIRIAKEYNIDLDRLRAYMEKRDIMGMLTTIHESGQRVAKIVDNMLNFARKSNAVVSTCNLPELINQTLALAATDYDLKKQYDFKMINIVKEYQDDLPPLPCEREKIQQVLLNLFRNGAQAMQGAAIKNPQFTIKAFVDDAQNMVEIEIRDNGPGMDETTRKRIFEPFFTTKPVGIGTGLGLSVSYFIITENHRGEITVDSQPGKGAAFSIRLPLERDGFL